MHTRHAYNGGMKRYLIAIWIILATAFSILGAGINTQVVYAQEPEPRVLLLKYDGPVTSVMVDYVTRAIQTADERSYTAIVLEMNTPGGSIELMNRVVQSIRSSQIPVIVYISPRGAIAGSAGTIITLAGHASAMAPETAIGAASPVGGNGEDIGTTMESKVKEILKATVRGLASKRGPDAIRLAEDTIENAKAVSVDEAVEIQLVDAKATDINDLLQQLDGFTVTLPEGEQDLKLDGVTIELFEMSFIERLLMMLTNPNLLFLLLAIGAQAILIEISSPGGWVAGFLGICCVALAIYGMGILPVNLFGLVFIVAAFVLFILDIKAPTHGALTAAGTVSFIVGALVMFNSIRLPGYPTVSIPLVIGTGLFLGAFFFGIVSLGILAQKKPIKAGRESMIGRSGYSVNDIDPHGEVQVAGERWSAYIEPGTPAIPAGTHISVTAVEGIRLRVKQLEE